jgi:hypothetical protein
MNESLDDIVRLVEASLLCKTQEMAREDYE